MVAFSQQEKRFKTGDLLAWSVRGWGNTTDAVSQVIRAVLRSEYCHVGNALVIDGMAFVVEALPPAIRLYPLDKLTPFYHIQIPTEGIYKYQPYALDYENELFSASKRSAQRFLLDVIGEEYSRIQAVMSLFDTPPRDNKWQCAELANAFYREMGLDLGETYTPSAIVEAALNIIDTDGNPVCMSLVTPDTKLR